MTDAFALMRACREAGETHGLRMVTAAVLLHMATYAKADGTGCHPAIRTVARRMNTSNKVICRAVDELVAAGWLVEAGSAGRGCRVWRMTVPPVPVGNHSTGSRGEPVPEGDRSPWGTTTGPRGEPDPVPVGNPNNHGTTNELPSLKEHAPRVREAEADSGMPNPEGQDADRESPPHSKPSPRQSADSPESAQGATPTAPDARGGGAGIGAGQNGAQPGAYAADTSAPVEGYGERFARLSAAATAPPLPPHIQACIDAIESVVGRVLPDRGVIEHAMAVDGLTHEVLLAAAETINARGGRWMVKGKDIRAEAWRARIASDRSTKAGPKRELLDAPARALPPPMHAQPRGWPGAAGRKDVNHG